MSQTQALTTAQLEAHSRQLANGTLADAKQVYADLYSQGYKYAGWAGGVASENTIAGVSAVNFLTGTAPATPRSLSCACGKTTTRTASARATNWPRCKTKASSPSA